MKISVVTVCYNAIETIEETMLSVLNQTYPEIEYIIIDGGSTDGTVDIIKKYADKLAYWVSEPDKGIYDAMNKGIVVATGDYINFMNAGDRFFNNDIINELIPFFLPKGDAVIYGNNISYDGSNSLLFKPRPIKKLIRHGCFCHQAAFIFNKGLKYDLKYKIAADYDLFAKLKFEKGWQFVYVDKTVCWYSFGGLSDNNIKIFDETLAIASKYGCNSGKLKNKGARLVLLTKIAIKKVLGNRSTQFLRRIANFGKSFLQQ